MSRTTQPSPPPPPSPKGKAQTVYLSAQWSVFVQGLVASGRYASVSEVMREGLRLIQAREEREQKDFF